MKQAYTRRIVFIGRSLLWSVLLYTVVVLIIDWEEMLAKLNKEQPAAFLKKNEQPVVSPNVAEKIYVLKVANAIWQQLTVSAIR